MKIRSVHKTIKRRKRRLRKFTTDDVRTALGELEHGVEIHAMTMGKFSLIDLMMYVLEEIGPADVDIATWSASAADVTQVRKLFCESGLIRSCRWVLDFSFARRKPEYCIDLIDKFGLECIRVLAIHGKFVTLRNEEWNVCIRTSMNLNQNPRIESFELSDDADLCGFYCDFTDDVFNTQGPGVILDRPSVGLKATERLNFEDARKRGRRAKGRKPFFLTSPK